MSPVVLPHRPDESSQQSVAAILHQIWLAAGGGETALDRVDVEGTGNLPSAFAVTDLAAASIGAAGLAVSELIGTVRGSPPRVIVDRRLASFWFASSLRPQGWSPPPPWDPIAGDYPAADGWIRLHTNAPAHRRAALAVLRTDPDRASVGHAVANWSADALETGIVMAGGCAAAMRSLEDWAGHPQGRSVAAEPLIHGRQAEAGPPLSLALDRSRPLRGVKVLDLTRVLAGPVATRFLAGFGATVLRIDPPDWDEPAVVPEVMTGKATARLDLRDACGLDRLRALLRHADVLLHWLPAGCARPVRPRCRGPSRALSRSGRRVSRCLWLERALATASRLRQPRPDERRSGARRDAGDGQAGADTAAGAGARPCDGIYDGGRNGAGDRTQGGARSRRRGQTVACKDLRPAGRPSGAPGRRTDPCRRPRRCGGSDRDDAVGAGSPPQAAPRDRRRSSVVDPRSTADRQ